MPTNPSDFPYVTRLDIKHGPLELIDVQSIADSVTDKWFNQTLCRVNDSVLRIGVLEGEYHWHKHDDLDELFYVVDGLLIIDLEDESVELHPKQAYMVPRGIVHRTRAPHRTIILMVEGADIVPTGD